MKFRLRQEQQECSIDEVESLLIATTNNLTNNVTQPNEDDDDTINDVYNDFDDDYDCAADGKPV
jgi:hypothetical protein